MEKIPRVNYNEFKEWNERMIQKYDPEAFHRHSNPFIRFIERKRVKVILNMIDPQKDDLIIEVGCGAGDVIEKAIHGTLYGVDISSSILNKAKGKMIHLFQGDAQYLPCKNGAFSKVICSEVLEHTLSPFSALNEIDRILKEEGLAIISIPNESLINRIKIIFIRVGIFRWLFPKMPEKMNDEWHLHIFSLKEWLNLFHKCFRVIGLRSIPFGGLPLRYVVLLEKREGRD